MKLRCFLLSLIRKVSTLKKAVSHPVVLSKVCDSNFRRGENYLTDRSLAYGVSVVRHPEFWLSRKCFNVVVWYRFSVLLSMCFIGAFIDSCLLRISFIWVW